MEKAIKRAPFEWANASQEILENLAKKVKDKIGTLWEPETYFREKETAEQKEERKLIEKIYNSNRLRGGTYAQKNELLLTSLAKQLNLPIDLPSFMPDYTKVMEHNTKADRPLTIDEIKDDLENRCISSDSEFYINRNGVIKLLEMFVS